MDSRLTCDNAGLIITDRESVMILLLGKTAKSHSAVTRDYADT